MLSEKEINARYINNLFIGMLDSAAGPGAATKCVLDFLRSRLEQYQAANLGPARIMTIEDVRFNRMFDVLTMVVLTKNTLSTDPAVFAAVWPMSNILEGASAMPTLIGNELHRFLGLSIS